MVEQIHLFSIYLPSRNKFIINSNWKLKTVVKRRYVMVVFKFFDETVSNYN